MNMVLKYGSVFHTHKNGNPIESLTAYDKYAVNVKYNHFNLKARPASS